MYAQKKKNTQWTVAGRILIQVRILRNAHHQIYPWVRLHWRIDQNWLAQFGQYQPECIGVKIAELPTANMGSHRFEKSGYLASEIDHWHGNNSDVCLEEIDKINIRAQHQTGSRSSGLHCSALENGVANLRIALSQPPAFTIGGSRDRKLKALPFRLGRVCKQNIRFVIMTWFASCKSVDHNGLIGRVQGPVSI